MNDAIPSGAGGGHGPNPAADEAGGSALRYAQCFGRHERQTLRSSKGSIHTLQIEPFEGARVDIDAVGRSDAPRASATADRNHASPARACAYAPRDWLVSRRNLSCGTPQ